MTTTRMTLFAAALLACLLIGCCRGKSRAESYGIRELPPEVLRSWMEGGRPYLLIDVREDDEWKSGHAAGALHIPRWTLSHRIAAVAPDHGACIVLYCKGGVRSAASAATLKGLGYTNVYSLTGGFLNYQRAGLPVQ